jgi:tetratricopeptide (TPR) repeat protein
MKKLLIAMVGVCVAGSIAYYLGNASKPANVAQVTLRPEPESKTATEPAPPQPDPRSAKGHPLVVVAEKSNPAAPGDAPVPAPASPGGRSSTPLAVQQSVQTLLSPQPSFAEKQGAWSRLKDAGQLDQAIQLMEQGASAHPQSPEYPATLGQAYLQKASTLKDIREQGILGMKADQSFDSALALDPANWEAGFWKAAALSYWPPQLNKGGEVIERFLDLIKLQETQPPRPEYAQSYVFLGEQYQKQGHTDVARQVWQRGASLFPDDGQLSGKLADSN